MSKVNKQCKIHGEQIHYTSKDKFGSLQFHCKKCSSERINKRREKLKLLAINYLGGKCIADGCGYNKCLAALEFHHKDPSKKDFGISKGGINKSWEKLKTELDKCVLLCSNCHKEIHYGLRIPNWQFSAS